MVRTFGRTLSNDIYLGDKLINLSLRYEPSQRLESGYEKYPPKKITRSAGSHSD